MSTLSIGYTVDESPTAKPSLSTRVGSNVSPAASTQVGAKLVQLGAPLQFDWAVPKARVCVFEPLAGTWTDAVMIYWTSAGPSGISVNCTVTVWAVAILLVIPITILV